MASVRSNVCVRDSKTADCRNEIQRVAVNKVEEALDYLERAADIGTVSEDWTRYDEDLNNLRSHERFKAILKKVAA